MRPHSVVGLLGRWICLASAHTAIHPKAVTFCWNLIKIELVLTRDFYATTKLNPEHVEIGVTNAIHIGSGVFTESLVRWMDRDFPRSPFTVLDMSLPNEELKSTIA